MKDLYKGLVCAEYSPYITWKQCTKCKIEKDFEYFAEDSSTLSGLSSHCKSCKRRSKRAHYYKNPHKQVALNAIYRANKIQATPSWYEKDLVGAIYKEAKLLGNDYHVDHIVPLKSKLVCGLHCIDNLQILSATDNMKKSNKHII